MAAPATARMGIDEFLRWSARQSDEFVYELVRDVPHAMVRPVIIHQIIVENLSSALNEELDGGTCISVPEALVEVAPDTFRVPDVAVLCDVDDLSGRYRTDPTVLIEVLLPSAMDVDLFQKHEEYRGIASLKYFAFVSADRAQVALWSRGTDEWTVEEFEGFDASVRFEGVGAELPLERIYRRTGLA